MMPDPHIFQQENDIQTRIDSTYPSATRPEPDERLRLLTARLTNYFNSRMVMARLCRRDLEHEANRLLHGRIPQPLPRRPEPLYRFKTDKQPLHGSDGPRLRLPQQRVVDMLGRYARFPRRK